MAFVVRRPNGSWEIRESRATDHGPRARTLATFRELTPEVLERAHKRASTRLDDGELLRAAGRAGAPIAMSAVDRTTRTLLAQLGDGQWPGPALRRLLVQALGSRSTPDFVRWMDADAEARGEALYDLLLLTDSLPPPRRPRRLRFPRLQSRAA